MASGNDRLVSCSSSSSLRLLLFMIPLIVISGCASVLGSRNSSWGFISRHPWPWSSPSAATITSVKTPQVPSTKESEGLLDLHSTVVGVHHREEAISEDSVLNRSSSPPLDVEAAQPPPAAAVRLQLLLWIYSISFLVCSFLVWLLLSSVFKDFAFAGSNYTTFWNITI